MKKLFIFTISFSFFILGSFIVLKICLLRQYNSIDKLKTTIESKQNEIKELDEQIDEYKAIINSSNEDIELWKKKIEEIQNY